MHRPAISYHHRRLTGGRTVRNAANRESIAANVEGILDGYCKVSHEVRFIVNCLNLPISFQQDLITYQDLFEA